MSDLDSAEIRRQCDTDGMLDRICELPEQCRKAWDIAVSFDLPSRYAQVKNVVLLGMGGSAIGGDLVRTLTSDEMHLPMQVVRDYDLPQFVSSDTLVVASSYSGNTEETLAAFAEARGRGASLLAICTGGKLKDLALRWGAPCVEYQYNAQPRAALGYSTMLLLGLWQRLGFVSDKSKDVSEAVSVLADMSVQMGADNPLSANPAKAMAQSIHGRLPVIYGSGILSEVARRWKGQFNENSKAWGFYEQLPELNHNAVVGYEHPVELKRYLVVVFLQSAFDHARVKVRQTVTQQILSRAGVPVEVVHARGSSALAQQMSAVFYGDFVSYYLSLLYRVDPTPVAAIDYLKEQLSLSVESVR